MNHQPYETWLLGEMPVTPQQQAELQQHLESCPDCRRLETGWKQARQQMLGTPMAAPRPGFVARYQAGLAERRARLARRQALRLIAILTAAMAGTGLVIAIWLAFTTTPLMLLLTAVDTMSRIIQTFSSLQQALRFLLSNTHPLAVAVIWVFVSGWVAVLSTAWVCSVYRLIFKGVTQK